MFATELQTIASARASARRYQRKTRDEWVLLANYGYGVGWEEENTETTREDARRSLREYRENGPPSARYRLRKVRVPL